MFGQVLHKLASWVSSSFLLSSFFPWLTFSVTNLLMAYAAFPSVRPLIDRYVSGEPGDKAVVILLATGAVAVAAYITAPLIQVMTEVLEGRYLPQRLAQALTVAHADYRLSLEQKRADLLLERQQLRRLSGETVEDGPVARRLRAARAEGLLLRTNLYPTKISAAEVLLEPLLQKRRRNQLIQCGELSAAVDQLIDALSHNCGDRTELRKKDIQQIQWSTSLHNTFRITIELLKYAVTISSQQHVMALLDQQRQFGTGEVAPTRLGNYAAALRSYCDTCYGFDFGFFWPRLQLVLQKDEKRSTAVVNTKIQLNFTVWLLWLTALFTVIWLVVLGLFGESLLMFLAVATLGPLATGSWLGLVHATYAAFADTVRSVVDLDRLNLLGALHRPLPASTQAEKRAWVRVIFQLMYGSSNDIPLKHP